MRIPEAAQPQTGHVSPMVCSKSKISYHSLCGWGPQRELCGRWFSCYLLSSSKLSSNQTKLKGTNGATKGRAPWGVAKRPRLTERDLRTTSLEPPRLPGAGPRPYV